MEKIGVWVTAGNGLKVSSTPKEHKAEGRGQRAFMEEGSVF